MPAPEGRGSLEHVMDELVQLAASVHPSLSVARWWRPDVSLPAIYHWMTPSDDDVDPRGVAGGAPCPIRAWARITATIAVDPAAVPGEGDLLQLEAYFDLALPIYAGAIYSRNPLGQREARMRSPRTVPDELGGASILTLELPLEIALDVEAVPPTP